MPIMIGTAGPVSASGSPAPAGVWPAPATPPPTAESDSWLVGGGQWLGGFTTAAVGLGGLVFAAQTGPTGVYFALAVTPLAVGGVVCSLGRTSRNYAGSCKHSVVGAYVGAASIVPLALAGLVLGTGVRESRGDWDFFAGGIEGAAIGAAVGWLIVQPLFATLAWHTFKKPRKRPSTTTAPALFGSGPTGMAPGQRLESYTFDRSRTGRPPAPLMLPLLSGSF